MGMTSCDSINKIFVKQVLLKDDRKNRPNYIPSYFLLRTRQYLSPTSFPMVNIFL